VIGSFWKDRLIDAALPQKAEYTVVDAGVSSGSGDKLARLETGAEIYVPFYIEDGEKVFINTDKRTCMGRAEKKSYTGGVPTNKGGGGTPPVKEKKGPATGGGSASSEKQPKDDKKGGGGSAGGAGGGGGKDGGKGKK
jgi:hypothetical protein